MRHYRGIRDLDGCHVHYRDDDGPWTPLPPRSDLVNHSPDGFEWGYGGSGPAQLALALCADAIGDEVAAVRLHQDFKARVVAALPRGEWGLTIEDVLHYCERIGREQLDRAMGRL